MTNSGNLPCTTPHVYHPLSMGDILIPILAVDVLLPWMMSQSMPACCVSYTVLTITLASGWLTISVLSLVEEARS